MDTQSKSLASAKALAAVGLLASALLSATPATAARIGYYDLELGEGQSYPVAPDYPVAAITAAGHTAVKLTTLSPTELANVDVLFALNPDNVGYGAPYLGALSAIETAVNNGLVLCFADRHVTSAAKILPGGNGISFTRNLSSNIDIADNTTLVTNGPGGVVTNTNLDGGNFSNHGFASSASLPAGNRVILVDGANQAVTFSYPRGSGAVVYSTVPLDAYLKGEIHGSEQVSANLKNIYGPNVVAYCASLGGERSSLGPISVRYCHSAGHSGDAACVKNGLATTGYVASQTLPPTGCAPGEPTTGTANVSITAGDAITFTWADINCGTITDSSQSFQVNAGITEALLGTVLEMKAEHATMSTVVRLRVVPRETEFDFIDGLARGVKRIVIESLNDGKLLERWAINGGERLVVQLKNGLPDVFTSASVKFWVGHTRFFGPKTIIVKAFFNGTQVGQDTRVLSAQGNTRFSELQVYTPGNFGNNAFDKLEFSAAPGSWFGLGSVFFNTTRPVSP